VVLLPRVAAAECIHLPSSHAVQSAAVVFSGTAMNERGKITFEVDSVWKGPVTKQFFVILLGGVEQFEFKFGQKYLVFARIPTEAERRYLNLLITERQIFVIGSCGDGTREMARVTRQEIAELGRARAPVR
jgi:hypothetical protein